MQWRYQIAGWASKTFPKAKKSKLLVGLFDAFLLSVSAVFYRKSWLNILKFKSTVRTWENVHYFRHHMGGIQFNIDNYEICHIHGNGIIDINWHERKERDWLINNNICQPHHIETASKLTSFYLSKDNLRAALRYAKIKHYELLHKDDFLDSNGNTKPWLKNLS